MDSRKVNQYKKFWQIIILLAIDAAFFSSTNASKVAPIVLIIGFLLLLVSCYLVIYALLSAARLYGLPLRHKKQFAVFLSLIAGLVLALQSIGELSLRDILVLLPLVTIGYLYTMYSSAHRRNLKA